MNRYQRMVQRFQEVFRQPKAERPGLGDGFPVKLRTHLIREEAEELATALGKRDIVAALDGLCDLLYVVYGTADAMRVDLDPFFEAVHRANMAKLDPATGKPIFREDIPGRVIKPAGWRPPDIEAVWSHYQDRYYCHDCTEEEACSRHFFMEDPVNLDEAVIRDGIKEDNRTLPEMIRTQLQDLEEAEAEGDGARASKRVDDLRGLLDRLEQELES